LFRIASPTARSIWAAVRIAPVIFSPCCFLREPDQIRAGDVVVVPDLGPAHPREETLCGVGVDVVLAAQAVSLLIVDPVWASPTMAPTLLIPG
jgi:hypothetical protein